MEPNLFTLVPPVVFLFGHLYRPLYQWSPTSPASGTGCVEVNPSMYQLGVGGLVAVCPLGGCGVGGAPHRGGAAWISPALYGILSPNQLSFLPFSFFVTTEREESSGVRRKGERAIWCSEGGSAGCAGSLYPSPTPTAGPGSQHATDWHQPFRSAGAGDPCSKFKDLFTIQKCYTTLSHPFKL